MNIPLFHVIFCFDHFLILSGNFPCYGMSSAEEERGQCWFLAVCGTFLSERDMRSPPWLPLSHWNPSCLRSYRSKAVCTLPLSYQPHVSREENCGHGCPHGHDFPVRDSVHDANCGHAREALGTIPKTPAKACINCHCLSRGIPRGSGEHLDSFVIRSFLQHNQFRF